MGFAVTVAVTLSSGAVTALATCLRTWIIQRRSDLSVEIRRPDGPTVRIDAKRVGDAEALIQRALSSSQGSDGPMEPTGQTEDPRTLSCGTGRHGVDDVIYQQCCLAMPRNVATC